MKIVPHMTIIGISGSYGGLNLGDEAILTSAIAELRAAAPGAEIVVLAREPDHTRRHHSAERVINPRTLLREEIVPEIKRLDLLLLGGGGILYDAEARTYLREVAIAHEHRVPTFAFAIGVGPLRHRDEQKAVREGLNAMAGITVREISAKRLLEEIGVDRPVVVTADPAFLLEPEPFTDEMLRLEGLSADERLIGLSIRERGPAAPDLTEAAYHQLLADTADYIVRRFDARAVFVPTEMIDVREAHRVIGRMAAPQRAHVLRYAHAPRQVLGLMSRFEMAIGMRLHFLIFAALAGVPLMALPYASKVADLLDALGLPRRPVLSEERAGALLADIDRLWDERDEQQELLRDRVPRLQALARHTVPLALEPIREMLDRAKEEAVPHLA
jgi:polysaccharide pyruvyl transferase CsaB